MTIAVNQANIASDKAAFVANKRYILTSLFGLALFGLGFFIEYERSYKYSIWTSFCILYSIYSVYITFSNRRFLLATSSLFVTYGVSVVWLTNYMMDLPMSSWRAGWESRVEFPHALGIAILYLTYLSVLLNVALAILPTPRIGHFSSVGKDYRIPVLALAVLSGATLFVIAGSQARDQYLLDADVGSMFLVQASSLMTAVLFAFSLFFMPKGIYRIQANFLLVFIALTVGANGFRFILVIFAFIWLFYLLSTRRFSTRWILAMTAATVLGYVFLLILAYTRAMGMTFGQALAFAVQPDFNAAFRYIGGADQGNIVAQDYYYWHRGELLLGQTYLDAFLRLAPNIVHTTFFDTLRAQDYIVETGSFVPDVFRQRNWTMGSHLFVEALINFGRAGPYLMMSIFVLAMALLEKWSRSSHVLFLGYIVTASMGYSLAWYGFANSLKQGVFAFACGFIVVLAGKLLRGRSARLSARRSPAGYSA